MPCGWDSVFGFLIAFSPFLDSTVYHALYQDPSWKTMTGKFPLDAFPAPPSHSPVVVKELGGTKHDLTASSSYV